jgi:predicted kinase
VFETLRYVLRQRLTLARPLTYIDATNLTPEERRPYIEIGQLFGCEVDALFFDVPLDVCMTRNAQRHRIVPEEAMRKLAAKLQKPYLNEGFSHIVIVY